MSKYLQEQASHHSSGKMSKGHARWKGKTSARKNISSYMNVSSESLWSEIQKFAKLKYQVLSCILFLSMDVL